MKKIIIVDDESTIRMGLAALIKNTRSFEIAAVCKNGQEALESIINLKPDIMITDIRMPVMDGIALIEKCRELDIPVKIIILSGYGEFEYARAALRLEAYDYILKPVNREQLLKLIDEAAAAIDEEGQKLKLLKTQAGLSCLQSPDVPADIICQSLSGLNMSDGKYQVLAITPVITYPYPEDLNENIRNHTDVYLGKKNLKNYITLIKNEITVAILCFEEIVKENCTEILSGIIEHIEAAFGIKAILGIGRIQTSLSGIPQSYTQALSAPQEAIYSEDGNIFHYQPGGLAAGCLDIFYSKETKQFERAVFECNIESALEILTSFFEDIPNRRTSPVIVYSFCNWILEYLSSYLSNLSLEAPVNFKLLKKKIEHSHTIAKLKNELENTIKDVFPVLNASRQKQYGHLVDEAVKYAQMHYMEDITVNGTCEKFYVNVSYFCKVFKAKTGAGFNEYLTNLRIKKAKELIKYENLKVYEIAAMVGYSNPKYFAKVFKENTGMTPKEYQNKG